MDAVMKHRQNAVAHFVLAEEELLQRAKDEGNENYIDAFYHQLVTIPEFVGEIVAQRSGRLRAGIAP